MKQIIVHNENQTIDVVHENEKIDLEASFDKKYCLMELKVNSNNHTSRELHRLLKKIQRKIESLKPFN